MCYVRCFNPNGKGGLFSPHCFLTETSNFLTFPTYLFIVTCSYFIHSCHTKGPGFDFRKGHLGLEHYVVMSYT